ncbi:MAG: Spy/CpxP family protein refolding chaperone [Desulfobacteraceae bacterium]|nr:Spy/CpxP family protein refolding chaperone [Desulfobacteraceae bacterium]
MKQNKSLYFPVPRLVAMTALFFAFCMAGENSAGAGDGRTTSYGMERGTAVEHAEDQIKFLQKELMITESQRELWYDVVLVMRQNAEETDAFDRKTARDRNPPTLVEQMRIYARATEIRLDQLNRLLPPFQAFYSLLSDEQRRVADAMIGGPEDRPRRDDWRYDDDRDRDRNRGQAYPRRSSGRSSLTPFLLPAGRFPL